MSSNVQISHYSMKHFRKFQDCSRLFETVRDCLKLFETVHNCMKLLETLTRFALIGIKDILGNADQG